MASKRFNSVKQKSSKFRTMSSARTASSAAGDDCCCTDGDKLACPAVFGAATSCPHPKCTGKGESKAYKKGHVPGCAAGARPPDMTHGVYNTSQAAMRKKTAETKKKKAAQVLPFTGRSKWTGGQQDAARALVTAPPACAAVPSAQPPAASAPDAVPVRRVYGEQR